jgi:hypothetical protein
MAASSAKGYLACPSAGLATVFRGAVDCSKLARAMRLPEQQQRAAQFRAWLYLTAASTLRALVSVPLGPNSI